MDEWKQRLVKERDELKDRARSLGAFILGDVFPGLPAEDKELLHRQLNARNALLVVLNERVTRAVV